MTFECYACGFFRHSLAVWRCGVVIVHTVSQSIIHKVVNSLLVNYFAVSFRIVHSWPTHTSVTENRHFVARVMVYAVGHLVGRHFFGSSVFVSGRCITACECRSGGDRAETDFFQEISSAAIRMFFFTIHS